MEYRPVRVRGRFDHRGELHMFPRPRYDTVETGGGLFSTGASRGAVGVWVITPFIVAETG